MMIIIIITQNNIYKYDIFNIFINFYGKILIINQYVKQIYVKIKGNI